ncbi:MAG: O-antigen ligase family protein, partial [Chloroflexota bacterium]
WARHHEGRRRLIWAILFSALGVMIVAWLNPFTPGHIYWRKIETPGFMGPFTGRNIFADYLVLSSLVGIGFVIQRWWPMRGVTHQSHLTWVAFAITACAVGWVMASASRGACLSWVAGLLLFGFFLWRMDEKGQRSIGVFIGLILVAALTVIYAQTLVKRIDTTPVDVTLGRALAWKQSLKMGFDHGWTGVGLGNFPWVFPQYQPGNRAELFTHPENEYLEWWNETGWIGSFLILLLVVRIGRKLAVMHKWKDIEWQAGGLAALGALLVHSFFDFPLHIPANAFLAVAILGLVWGNLMRHPDEMPSLARGWPGRLAAVLGGAGLICLAVFALRAERHAGRGDFAGAGAFWPVEPKYR